MLQDSTKNSLRGISPLSNRKMFTSYYQPIFLYGTDTMQINKTDMDRLEISYRHILKKLMCLPDSVASPAVYLSIGIFPAEAQRDLDIVGLFGQLAVCPDDIQKTRKIIEGNLTFYSVNFHGWSALVRQVCLRYNLPDPLLYMQHPWRPDRWRKYCKETIGNYWNVRLKEEAIDKKSLEMFDTKSSSIFHSSKIWQQAGLNSLDVKMATVVNWMQMGVYQTREKLMKWKTVKSDLCLACDSRVTENLDHVIFFCKAYENIRQPVLTKLFLNNPHLVSILNNPKLTLIAILDPVSTLLPASVSSSWASVDEAYSVTRQMCYNIHKKREKIYQEELIITGIK